VAIPAALVAINLGCLVLNVCRVPSFWFIWVSPAVLALYALAARPRVSSSPLLPFSPSKEEAVPV
jgi:hypothetical protein